MLSSLSNAAMEEAHAEEMLAVKENLESQLSEALEEVNDLKRKLQEIAEVCDCQWFVGGQKRQFVVRCSVAVWQ